jgi:beta-lactamase regulating signal transducer with metallopeptidase domain
MLPIDLWDDSLRLPVWFWTAKAAVLVMTAGGAAFLLGRRSAALRHVAWSVALVGLLLAPLTAALPRWSLPASEVDRVAAIPELPASRPEAGENRFVPAVPMSGPLRVANPAPVAVAATSPPPAPSADHAQRFGWTSSQVLALLWLLPVAALLGVWGWRLVQVERLCRSARFFPAGFPQLALEEARTSLGVRRPVELLLTDAVRAPAVWGWRRPRILAPGEARNWSARRWRAVLLHELAHVERGDVVWQTLGDLAWRLWWWHPAAWLAVWQQRRSQELACDDRVLATGVLPSDYASELLALASGMGTRRSRSPSLALVHRSEVGRRVAAILDPFGHDLGSRSRQAVMAIFMAVACLTIWTATQEPPVALAQQGISREGDPELWRSLPEPAEGRAGSNSERLHSALAASAQEIERLRQSGRNEDANRAQQWLQAVQSQLQPGYLPPVQDESEVHVVGVRRGRPFDLDKTHAAVRISRRGAPIVLCLVSTDPLQWELTMDPGVRLVRVVLIGGEQWVEGLPANTTVTRVTEGDDGSPERLVREEPDGQVSLFASAFESQVGQAPSTFLWVDQAPRHALIIGPENETWREEAAVRDAEALLAELTRPRRLEQWRSLRSLEFPLLDPFPATRRHASPPASLKLFTLAGDTAKVLAKLPENAWFAQQAVWDERDKAAIVMHGARGILRVDAASAQVIASPISIRDRLGPLTGLAFDSKRRILWGTSRERLLRYDLDQSKWMNPLGLEDLHLRSLAYSASADAVFGLRTEEREGATLYRFDDRGAIVARLPLPDIPTAVRDYGWQLAAAGNYLVVLRHPEQEVAPTLAYVLDPDNGRAVFTSQLKSEHK